MKSPLACLEPVIRYSTPGSSAFTFGRVFVFLLAILVGHGVSCGQSNQCAALPAGLVAWWSAEGNATDFTGEHSGTFPYGSAFAAGEVGQSFDFDGSFRRVSITDSPAFQLTNAMTLEAWVYPRAYGGFITFRGDNRAGLDNWTVDTYDSGFVKFSLVDPANNAASVRAALALNQWQHVAATWDRTSGDLKIYVNGVLGGQTNSPIIPIGVLDSGSEPAIGIGNHGGTLHQFPFNGLVDELGIYGRALADIEVAGIFAAGSAGKCSTNNTPTNPPPATCVTPPAGLVSWWQAENSSADSAGPNIGILSGGMGFVPGKVGQGFDFNGSSQIKIPASSNLDVGIGSGLTLEMWMRPGHFTLYEPQFVFEWNNLSGGYGVQLLLSTDHGVYGDGFGNVMVNLVDTLGNSHGLFTASDVLVTNSFQHVALTYDKTSGLAIIYVNGLALVSTNLGSFTPQTSYDLYLGNRPAGPFAGSYFNGVLDEPSIYSRALSSAEIQAVYLADSAGKCNNPKPPTLNCTAAPPGMIGWWRAELGAADALGSHSGDALNGLRYTNGNVGQAFYFDGVDDRVIVPDSASLNFGPGANFSVEAWIKPESAATAFGVQSILDKRYTPNSITAVGWAFFLIDGRLSCQLADAPLSALDFSTFSSSGPDLRDGNYHHVALSVDRAATNGGTLAVDGQVVLTFDPTVQPGDLGNTEPLRIGVHADPTLNSHFAGAMDELSLYNRALTVAEIQSIFSAGSVGKCPTNPPVVNCAPSPANVVGWWPAAGDPSDIVANHDGVLAGAVTYSAGKVGQAFSFNSALAAVVVPASPSLNVGGGAGLTVEAWINPTDVTQAYPLFEWNDATYWGVHFYIAPGQPTSGSSGPPGPGQLYANVVDSSGGWHQLGSASGVVSANVFQHVALTYDKASGVATIYRNGEIVSQLNLGNFTPLTTYDLYLGRRQAPSAEAGSFAGLMDEPTVYDRALSQVEIQSIHNAGSAGKCPPQFSQPTITQQPQSVTTNVSATVRFEVAATGVPVPGYQWFFGNTPLANQTNAVLLLSNVQLAQAGLYSVQVSNIAGLVISSNAVLSIDLTQPAGLVEANSMGFYNDSLGTTLDGTAPQFPLPIDAGGGDPEFYPAAEPDLAAGAAILGNWLTNPAALNANWRSVTPIPTTWELNTETAIIYLVDGGNHGVSNLRADIDADNGIYVWVNGKYKFGARQPGLPSPLGQYEYTNVYLGELAPGSNYIQILREDSGIADGYQFRLRGTVLATYQSPIITQSPAPQTAIGGNAVTFHAAAIGSPDLKFQWQFNGVALTGQSNNSLTLANVLLSQAGEYTFVATNPYGAATSAVATLTVLAFPPVITRQPTNTTVIVGNTATLSVQATGSVTLAYQWLRDGSPLAGRTSTSLPFQNIQFSNAGNYSVIVTNLYGAATSAVAVLTVNPIPSCVAVHDGLVSWWKGENSALDSWDSNHGNNQFVNTTTLGKVGRAFSGPLINVNDSPSLRVTNGLTLEAWINPSTLSGVRVLVSKFDYPLFQPGVSQSAYLLGTTNNGALVFTLTPNGSVRTNTTLVTTNLIPLNQWTHVAATYDGSVMRLYLNGLEIGQTNYTGKIFPGGVPLGIGGFAGPSFQTSSPWQYSGLMDEVSLYNRALSPAEIQSIVAADLTGKCLAPPVITQQPQDQAVPLGEDVKFSVGVSGSRPLAYQWCIFRPDPRGIPFTLIPGATNATLIIEKVRTNNVGPYFVIVTNSAGSSYSATAQLSTIPAPTCVDVLPGLISWWPGDTNLLDAIGLNHISTYTPAGYPIGKVASAFTFNGVNSRITINNSASLNFGANTNFSIEMWIKANVTNAFNPNVPLLEKRDTLSSGWKGYSLSLYKGQLAFALGAASVSTNALYVSSGPDLRDGMFHHVAVTLNRATTNGGVLYVDGAPVLVFDSRVLTNSLVTPGPLYIGGPATTFSNSYFAGMIDEPAIYDRALTTAEILSIRTAGAAGRCKAAPLILTQPVGGAVALGSNFTLTVVATGIPAPRYQWRKGTSPVAGATNATFILSNFTAADAGAYTVAVSNVFGAVISSNAVVARNFLPIANADALNTPSNTPAGFPVAKLTLNDTDADGDLLVVTAVSPNSSQNGTVSLVSGMVTYSPPANFVGNDTFTYTVGDGRGGTAIGTVMATVGNGGAAPLNIVFGPTVEVDQFVVRFAGIPGLTYTIEAAPTPNGPWSKVANLAAPSTDTGFGIGVFEFRETVTGESARYYRTVYPSY